MGEHVIRMPDIGEGVAEAELVEWYVKIGDLVREDTMLVAMMTEKATVEIPSPVDGKISWLGAEIGDMVAVGAALVKIETAEKDGRKTGPAKEPAPERPKRTASPGADEEKPLAAPAVRQRAKTAGIDLRKVQGSGPEGRVTHEDLDDLVSGGQQMAPARRPDTTIEEIRVVGLRRRIADKMALANKRIPHITYIEEVNVTALEDLRGKLNGEGREDRPKLTLLPFLMLAMVKAVAERPLINALYDDDAGVIHRHGGVHIGIATQTASGLVVPVVRHVETRGLWDCAAEVARLAEAAKAGTATRADLSGSTITITSLGAMGGIATTPIINHPEVAIVGVNRIAIRPLWDGTQFIPAKMMNLSSSFDHRVIDGWDAAVFVQRIRTLLETPALLFVE